jgi:glucuronoarabinoxylan endo-1,4-beta-xylanase
LETSRDNDGGREKEEVAAAYEYSAYIKGNTIIVMAINTTQSDRELKIKLPFKVKSGVLVQSLGNEAENLCQEEDIPIDGPVSEVLVKMPYESLSTYILTIDDDSTAIEGVSYVKEAASGWCSLDGRRLSTKPTKKGLYLFNGKKVVIK